MSYLQAKRIVLSVYRDAELQDYKKANCNSHFFYIEVDGKDLLNRQRYKTKAEAWIAAAELIKPKPVKPEVAKKQEHWPLAERFFKRDKKQLAKRLAYEMGQYRKRWTNKSLAAN